MLLEMLLERAWGQVGIEKMSWLSTDHCAVWDNEEESQ